MLFWLAVGSSGDYYGRTTRAMKLTIYQTDDHDHRAVFIDNKLVYCHDYNTEGVLRVARHLKWEVEIINLTGEQFELKFA